MKSIEALSQYYETDILPVLSEIEEQRKRIKKKLIPLLIVAAIVFVIGFGLIVHFSANIKWLIIPACIAFVLVAGWYFAFYKDFLDDFKEKVICKIVQFIDPNLTYDKTAMVSKSKFIESRLFNLQPDYYTGEDFVSGKIDKTDMQFSELNVKHVVKTRDTSQSSSSSRKYKTESYPIFRGLFFVADFNKDFSGATIVLPDKAEKLLGRLGKKFQAMNISRGDLISLEDPEFEKFFVVYGEDQIEARYILSASLMQRIVEFRKKTNKEIFISFVLSKVYVAVPYDKPLFEPGLFKTLIDFSRIQEYYEDLQLAIGIVEDLNLNTRIWNKA